MWTLTGRSYSSTARPERVPHRVVVAPLGQRVVRDEDAAEAELLDAVQLARGPSAGSVIEMLATGNRRFGRVRGVLGGPVVVGAVGVALELLVGMAEQRHAEAAVEDLGAEAVEVHVLQALDGVPAARPAHRVAAPRELLELLGRDAGAAEAGRVERPQRLADQEIAGLAVVLVLQVRRAVAEPRLHARRPQVGWLQDVRVGGQDLLHHGASPPLGLGYAADRRARSQAAGCTVSANRVICIGAAALAPGTRAHQDHRDLFGAVRDRVRSQPRADLRRRAGDRETVDPALGHQVGIAGLPEVAALVPRLQLRRAAASSAPSCPLARGGRRRSARDGRRCRGRRPARPRGPRRRARSSTAGCASRPRRGRPPARRRARARSTSAARRACR